MDDVDDISKLEVVVLYLSNANSTSKAKQRRKVLEVVKTYLAS